MRLLACETKLRFRTVHKCLPCHEELKKYGCWMKFPAKSGDLSRRWCSAYLKIAVADSVISNLDRLEELEKLGGKRHKSHPCYRAGWNRCSCAACIFSTPKMFAGFKELYPEEFVLLKQDEKILGFTLDNKCNLETFIDGAESCVYQGDKSAIHSLVYGG